METSASSSSSGTSQREGAGLSGFFAGSGVDIKGLSAYLDGLSDAARAAATVTMTPRQQARVYDAAKGFRALTLEHLVPAGVPPLTQVIHTGKNSIAIFSRFEKRFCRPAPSAQGSDKTLWGYNHTPGFLASVVGPGYFVAYGIAAGELLVDYCQLPPSKPEAWPAILPNSARLSRYVYNGTKDTLRGISKNVSIGRAARAGKDMDNWFVLCRRDG